MRTPLVAALLFAGAASACSSPTDAPATPELRLASSTVWAGSELLLHTTAPVGDSLELRLSMDTTLAPLVARRVNDTTLAARVRPELHGTVPLFLIYGGTPRPIGHVTVYGYESARIYEDVHLYDLLIDTARPDVLVGADAVGNSGMVRITFGSSAVQRFGGTGSFGFSGQRGPGPTYRRGAYIGQRYLPEGSGSLQGVIWSFDPVPHIVDTFSLGIVPRQIMQPSANVLVWTGAHRTTISRKEGVGLPATSTSFQMEDPHGVYISPRGDRATFKTVQVDGGMPVLDARTGDIAYRVADLTSVDATSFSGDGELLAMAGSLYLQGPPRIKLLRAATGEILAERELQAAAIAVGFDPNLPYLYVAVPRASADPTVGKVWPTLLVLERATLTTVAELAVPESAPACGESPFCWGGAIGRSAEPAIYLATGHAGSLMTHRFAIPPGAFLPR